MILIYDFDSYPTCVIYVLCRGTGLTWLPRTIQVQSKRAWELFSYDSNVGICYWVKINPKDYILFAMANVVKDK